MTTLEAALAINLTPSKTGSEEAVESKEDSYDRFISQVPRVKILCV